jgi:hypothetical protein
VDRGECTFVKKVRNAQRAGAAAVLIADDMCLCSHVECVSDDVLCEDTEPIMADDGSGADISIPSFLLFKEDSDPIKEVLMKNQAVRVSMAFSLPAPDSRVEYDMWTTPSDPLSRSILMNFKEAAVALGDEAFFTPHMYIYDGLQAGCRGANGENQCFSLCTNNGRYCSTDPDDDLDKGISGADVVKESLRRICIWHKYGFDGVGREWWNYVDEFMFRCSDPANPDFFTNPKCISDAMTHAGIDEDAINFCMEDSNGLEGDLPNAILEDTLVQETKAGVVLIPSFFVNQAPVRGAPSFSTVFRAVCSGYAAGSEPDVCVLCATCHDEVQCVSDGVCTSGGGGTLQTGVVSSTIFMASLAVLVVVFGILSYIQYQRQQAYMHDHVRGIMVGGRNMMEHRKSRTNKPLHSHLLVLVFFPPRRNTCPSRSKIVTPARQPPSRTMTSSSPTGPKVLEVLRTLASIRFVAGSAVGVLPSIFPLY